MLRRLTATIRGLWQRRQAAGEIDDEIAFHVAQETAQHLAAGVEPVEARRRALAALGGVAQTAASTRAVRSTWADRAWQEIRSAWTGVRARGWRGALVVAMLGLALSANTLTFSVADSLIFDPAPYPNIDRIVALTATADSRMNRAAWARLLEEWSRQRDVVTAAGTSLEKNGVFLLGSLPERVSTSDVTLDLLDVLGARPAWGRPFGPGDLESQDSYAVLLSEALARRLFGRPGLALGKRLEATGRPLVVVGVMPSTFAFGGTDVTMWRLMDPRGPLTLNFGAPTLWVRVAPDVPLEQLRDGLTKRASVVGAAAGVTNYRVAPEPAFETSRTDVTRRTMLWLLLGAVLALLVVVVANASSLELTNALRRGRTHAVQLALGASRGRLVRMALTEILILLLAAFVLGTALSAVLLQVLVPWLTKTIRLATENPIHLGTRSLMYTIAVTAAALLVTAITPALAAARTSIQLLMARGNRSTATPTTVQSRQWLTAVEVALCVGLLVVGVLYERSYLALGRVEKGFDSAGLVVLTANIPALHFRSDTDRDAFKASLVTHLKALPGVLAVTTSMPPPSSGDSPSRTQVQIDGKTLAGPVLIGRNWIDPSYFATMGLPLRAGRLLTDTDTGDAVVISDSVARHFWPNGDAVGHTIRTPQGFAAGVATVVGVVGDFRLRPTGMPTPADTELFMYARRPDAVSVAAAPQDQALADNGGMFQHLGLTVRLRPGFPTETLVAQARALDPSLAYTTSSVDDDYSSANADIRLTAGVVSAFSIAAFLIAMAGLYGVMSFFVASRTREIGIRAALGADPVGVRRLVLVSSARVVIPGALAGVLGAAIVSHVIASQLFGVSSLDLSTYAGVVAAVIATAVLATLQPTWQATRVDPAVTLRLD